MKNSSYYIAPVGDWTHDLPHTVASNMVKVSHALNHSATEAAVSAGSTRLLFSLKDNNNNTNGFQFSITYFIVVMNNLVYWKRLHIMS